MSAANVELARRGYEAALRGDFDAIAAILDADVKWHGGDPDAEGACRNSVEALTFMRKALAQPNLAELVDVRDAGDRVVLVLRRTGGGDDEVVANVTTFRDGKVVEMVHYAAVDEALRAVDLS